MTTGGDKEGDHRYNSGQIPCIRGESQTFTWETYKWDIIAICEQL